MRSIVYRTKQSSSQAGHRQRAVIIAVGLLAIVGILTATHATHAADIYGDVIAQVAGVADKVVGTILNSLARVLFTLTGLMAGLTLLLIKMFVAVASYNDFSGAKAVETGWVVVRDVANMLFVVALLVIAFGTVLKIQAYHYRNTLGKFVLFALLINFSRTIALLFIDFAQVVMFTFVSSFKDLFGSIFLDGLGFGAVLDFSQGKFQTTSEGAGSLMTAILTGVIIVIIFGIILSFTLQLIMRIVMLWFLLILSPLPYILSIFPGAQKYASQWWSMFTKYLLSGPVLVFFLWVSLTIIGATAFNSGGVGHEILGDESGDALGVLQGSLSAIGSGANLLSFIMSAGLLFASLLMSNQFANVGSSVAGKWAEKLQSAGIGVVKSPVKALGYAERKIHAATGVHLDPRGSIQGMRDYLAKGRAKDEVAGRQKVRGRIAERIRSGKGVGVTGMLHMASGASEDFAANYLNWRAPTTTIPGALRASFRKKGETSFDKAEKTEAQMRKARQYIGDKGLSQERRKELWEEADLSTKQRNSLNDRLKSIPGMSDREKKILEQEIVSLDDRIDQNKRAAGDRELIKIPEAEMESKIASRKDLISTLEPKAKSYRKKALFERMPSMFNTEQGRRAAEAEEEKRIQSDNWEELALDLQTAVAIKDKIRVGALMRKMTKDGNLNEVLNKFDYRSGPSGLEKFRKEVLQGQVGMDSQTSNALASDLTYIAEGIGHWNVARMYGVDVKTGLSRRHPDERTEFLERSAEMSKMDLENYMRRFNRLAYGDEIPDGQGGRAFSFSKEGMEFIIKNQMQIASSMKKERFNKNAVYHFLTSPIASRQLKKAVQEKLLDQDTVDAIQTFGNVAAQKRLGGSEEEAFERLSIIVD